MSVLAMLAAAAAAAVTVPAQPALTQQIEARDAALFHTLFLECDPAKMGDFLTDDIEFYHDRDGAMRGRAAFVAGYAKNCAARKDPAAWRSRRELVAASSRVDPIPGYGAVHVGDHLFRERKGLDGSEKLAGRARFANLWKLDSDGQWRLSRVLSFAHAAAGD